MNKQNESNYENTVEFGTKNKNRDQPWRIVLVGRIAMSESGKVLYRSSSTKPFGGVVLKLVLEDGDYVVKRSEHGTEAVLIICYQGGLNSGMAHYVNACAKEGVSPNVKDL